MQISVLLLVAQVGCTPPSDKAIVGLWESPPPASGLGTALELKADGSFVSTVTVILNQAYRVTDGQLFVAGRAKELGPQTDGMTLEAGGDILIQRDGAGAEIRKERMGQPPSAKNALQGAWRYRHYTGGIAFERYTSDGRFLFRLPIGSQKGCYSAQEGSLRLDGPQRQRVVPYSVAADTLTFHSDGKSHGFQRAEPWYPRDPIDYQPTDRASPPPSPAARHRRSRPPSRARPRRSRR